MQDRQPDAPQPISRRESLKRAAGALALGLGGSVAALAETGSQKSTLSFFKGRELVAEVDIPAEIAEVLSQPGAFDVCKIPAPPAPAAVFRVERVRSQEQRG
ncbi:MAG: hypothetical protein AAF170_11295 [Bacteroidota bacterium]